MDDTPKIIAKVFVSYNTDDWKEVVYSEMDTTENRQFVGGFCGPSKIVSYFRWPIYSS
jgi:hypothetical protein